MAAHGVTLTSARQPTSQSQCECGCASCAETCCGLDCLERPRFFRGQVLTDQDLNGLVDWTRSRLQLSRYRDGWGVVCGLDVGCDTESCSSVIIQPGYAVSCCGDDIVVCEPLRYDLKAVCRKDKDPCAHLEPAEGEPETVTIGCTQVDRAALRAVDLFIAYDEERGDPQTALGRNTCKETTRCEYGRTREARRLTWRAVPPGQIRFDEAAATAWKRRYDDCLESLTQIDSATDFAGAVRNAIRQKLQGASHQHCLVKDCVCGKDGTLVSDPPTLLNALFWVVQDWLRATLGCECHACSEHSEVRLARVWLHSTTDRSCPCRVLAIDAYPPFRRELRRDCWPAPLGQVNLGQVIGRRIDDARQVLSGMGIQVKMPSTSVAPTSVTALKTALSGNLFAFPGDTVTLTTVSGLGTDDPLGWGERVVGFDGATGVVSMIAPMSIVKATADDLTSILLIGPARAVTLRDAGIAKFDQLADAPMDKLRGLFPQLAEDALQGWKDAARTKAGK